MTRAADRARPSVVVMTRAPLPGATKTRLTPLLGHRGCARLHRALIEHTLAAAAGAVGAARVVVAVDPPGHLDTVGALARPIAPGGELIAQTGDDLGQRMAAASAAAHARHGGPVVVVGTDLPTLTAAIITDALGCLQDGRDVVFGPAIDGGYYLVALTRPAPELFTLPAAMWGGPDVLAASLARAADAGLRVAQLAPRRDLDTPEDLAALAGAGLLPAAVIATIPATVPATVPAAAPARPDAHTVPLVDARTGRAVR